jgi:hypothetical protein
MLKKNKNPGRNVFETLCELMPLVLTGSLACDIKTKSTVVQDLHGIHPDKSRPAELAHQGYHEKWL